MYNDYCQTCEALNLSLNSDKTLLDKLAKAVEDAYLKLHSAGNYEPKDVTDYRGLIDATNDVLTMAVEKGIADNVIPGPMKLALEKDVFLFSGLKTHAQLFEASRLLLDENKQVKSFSKFSQDIQSIKKNYNQNYLESEYNFATASAQMAAKWNDITQKEDRYNLQYRTAEDDKVRKSHEVLNGITLPAADAFWNQYYPPNGWRCRCDAVEVLNSKYDKSDSEEAVKRGEKATSLIGKDGKNRLEIFRFNPGKEKVIFPPKHPYYPQNCKGGKVNLSKAIGFASIILSTENDRCGIKKDLQKVFDEEKRALRKAKDAEMELWIKANIPAGGITLKLENFKTGEVYMPRKMIRSIIDHFTEPELKEMVKSIVDNLKRCKYVDSLPLDRERPNYDKKLKAGVIGFNYYSFEWKGKQFILNAEVMKTNIEKPYAVIIGIGKK